MQTTARVESLALLLEKAVSLSISLVVFVLLARYFEIDVFGQYSYYLALVTLFIPFFSLGLNSLITKELLSNTTPAIIVFNALIMRLGLGGIIVTLIIIFQTQIINSPTNIIFYILLTMSTCHAGQVFDFGFQAFQQNYIVICIRLFVLILGASLKIYGIEAQWTMSDILIIIAAEYGLTNGLMAYIFWRVQPNYFVKKLNIPLSRSLLKKSVWLYSSAICAILYLKLDQVMLGHLASSADVAQYAVATKFTELFYFIPVAIVTAYFPKLLKSAQTQHHDYELLLNHLNRILLYTSLIIIAVISLSDEIIIKALFADMYSNSVPIIGIQVWSLIFVFQRALLSKWILIENIFKFSLLSQALGAVTNIVLNLILIPMHGGLGAAWATVISYLMSTTIVLCWSAHTRILLGIQLRSMYWPISSIKNLIMK